MNATFVSMGVASSLLTRILPSIHRLTITNVCTMEIRHQQINRNLRVNLSPTPLTFTSVSMHLVNHKSMEIHKQTITNNIDRRNTIEQFKCEQSNYPTKIDVVCINYLVLVCIPSIPPTQYKEARSRCQERSFMFLSHQDRDGLCIISLNHGY